MKKYRNPINDAIEELTRLYDDELEDFLELEVYRQLIRNLRPLAETFDSLMSRMNKRMGRHANAGPRKKERLSDFQRYKAVEKLRAQGLSLEAACERVGTQVHKGYDTIKKAHARARKLLHSPAYRLSTSGMKPDV